jgi:6-phosphogluconolactonase
MPQVLVFPDPEALARAAAGLFISSAGQAIQQREHFLVALAGGSTPAGLYRLLADPGYADQLDWSKTHCFWGDERCVPPDHPHSNFNLAFQALLRHVALPQENLHRLRGELPPEQAAQEYEYVLRAFFGPAVVTPSPHTFDLALLGLGEDGHTASLFPASPALEIGDRWVVPVQHSSPPEPLVDRLSLTVPAFNAARRVIFLVSGRAKAGILSEVLRSNGQGIPKPAGLIQPAPGELLWLADRAAASQLPPERTG